MFPIRDHNPSQKTPVVAYLLIAANVLVFLGTLPAMDGSAATASLLYNWALIPARLSQGDAYHTLVTSMFLHGGFMHIAGNMLFLWIFGDNLEEDMGHLGFLAFYLAGGIGAGLIHTMAAPWSPVPTVGASGAIAAVMGGYLLMYPRARVDVLIIIVVFFRILPLPAWAMLGLWFALQLFNGVGADPSMGGVAYWAHAGGFIVGLVLTIPLFLRRGGPRYWRRTHGKPEHPEAKYQLQRSNIPRVPRRRR